MLNKGNLFSGKRADTPAQPSTIRPIEPATPSMSTVSGSPAPVTSVAGIDLPPSQETAKGSGDPGAARASAPFAGVQGARLVVGPGVKLKGAEIQDCDALVVEGRVEATMDSRLIQIADQGSFDGKVNIDVAEIHGRFRGEMTAREQIVIHATGRVSGKIRYGRIVVHEGGELSGDIRSLTAEEGASPIGTDDAETIEFGRLLASRTG